MTALVRCALIVLCFAAIGFESRLQAATYVVMTVDDFGSDSLRAVIESANANPGHDFIFFNIPGVGPHFIQPFGNLPDVTDSVTIDATTQPGFAGSPIIVLDGSLNDPDFDPAVFALIIGVGHCVIRGLSVVRFPAFGIYIQSGNENVIEGNYLGVGASGSGPPVDANLQGLRIDTSHNRVGGSTAAARNVISGNLLSGIVIAFQTGYSNLIQGNWGTAGVAHRGEIDKSRQLVTPEDEPYRKQLF